MKKTVVFFKFSFLSGSSSFRDKPLLDISWVANLRANLKSLKLFWQVW
jgi:hypothetical protein